MMYDMSSSNIRTSIKPNYHKILTSFWASAFWSWGPKWWRRGPRRRWATPGRWPRRRWWVPSVLRTSTPLCRTWRARVAPRSLRAPLGPRADRWPRAAPTARHPVCSRLRSKRQSRKWRNIRTHTGPRGGGALLLICDGSGAWSHPVRGTSSGSLKPSHHAIAEVTSDFISVPCRSETSLTQCELAWNCHTTPCYCSHHVRLLIDLSFANPCCIYTIVKNHINDMLAKIYFSMKDI